MSRPFPPPPTHYSPLKTYDSLISITHETTLSNVFSIETGQSMLAWPHSGFQVNDFGIESHRKRPGVRRMAMVGLLREGIDAGNAQQLATFHQQ